MIAEDNAKRGFAVGVNAARRYLRLPHPATGHAPLNYGIGVHLGDVMYRNIGSSTRLHFTGIDPAVNMASRLEALTKQLGKPVLLSSAFADLVKNEFDLERVGEYPVRGFNDPIGLFAYHG
jgi:adenylate cyclase